jgi:hypothetical protein
LNQRVLSHLLELDRFSTSSKDEFDDDFRSDVEATVSEPERDLKLFTIIPFDYRFS